MIPLGLQIEIVSSDATECRIRVGGEIDMATVGGLCTVFNEIVDKAPPGCRVVVDVADVVFLSAAGVRVMAQTGQRLRVAGAAFVVYPVSSVVERVLRVCGYADLLGLAQA